MQTMDGVITMVQESRFQMRDDRGVYHLFLLSHAAAAEPADLAPMLKGAARVRIRYDKAPNLLAQIAHRIECLDRLP